MGANGAGKSTLVKILTGAISANAGRILIRGEARDIRSPAAARRAGLLPVYQEPSLIPDLDVLSNLRLTGTPVEPFRAWVRELGIADLDLRDTARDIPLAVLRVLDLARALAVEPDVLLLDEMTAALPANLAEKVLEVVRRQGDAGRAVIFISHRFVEISALCDRATVLRDGETVGVVDIVPGVEEKIVELMLGTRIVKTHVAARSAAEKAAPAPARPRIAVRNLRVGTKLNDVSFDLGDGEVAGVVALEGQGQDELFAALAGSIRPSGGTIEVDGSPVKFSHPIDAIRAGIAYVPGDRSEALAMQRSVRENIALPFSAALRNWGPINMRKERDTVLSAIQRLQIDTRAQGEVQRLSGGNQQKVTIARWIAADARTILCFDPTRGIDVGTKQELYQLMRKLADAGAAILFYSTDYDELIGCCDRVLVLYDGAVKRELVGAEITERALIASALNIHGEESPVGLGASA